jgi:hypothetical protein
MALDHILPIIRNSYSFLVLSRVGALGNYFTFSGGFAVCSIFARCTAPPHDFEGKGYVRRSRDHTEALVEGLELGILWDEYGLVGDIVVGLS